MLKGSDSWAEIFIFRDIVTKGERGEAVNPKFCSATFLVVQKFAKRDRRGGTLLQC